MNLYYIYTHKVKTKQLYSKTYEYYNRQDIAVLRMSPFDFTGDFDSSIYKPWEKVGWERHKNESVNVCHHCGNVCAVSLTRDYQHPVLFCSYKCASKALAMNKSHSIRTNGKCHFINRLELKSKDRDVCGICKNFVEMAQSSIDHITPISSGGLHVWDNVQLAHYSCNMKRGNEELANMSGGEKCVQGQYIYRAGKQFIASDDEDESETISE